MSSSFSVFRYKTSEFKVQRSAKPRLLCLADEDFTHQEVLYKEQWQHTACSPTYCLLTLLVSHKLLSNFSIDVVKIVIIIDISSKWSSQLIIMKQRSNRVHYQFCY